MLGFLCALCAHCLLYGLYCPGGGWIFIVIDVKILCTACKGMYTTEYTESKRVQIYRGSMPKAIGRILVLPSEKDGFFFRINTDIRVRELLVGSTGYSAMVFSARFGCYPLAVSLPRAAFPLFAFLPCTACCIRSDRL